MHKKYSRVIITSLIVFSLIVTFNMFSTSNANTNKLSANYIGYETPKTGDE